MTTTLHQRSAICVLGITVAWMTAAAAQTRAPEVMDFGPDAPLGVSRVREGGTPQPHPSEQVIEPYSISLGDVADGAPNSLVYSPPEFSATKGVLFSWVTGQWNSVVTEMVSKMTSDPSKDEIAYVVTPSAATMSAASSAFIAAGADMSKVQFFIRPLNALWIRDYGPHFIFVNGTLGIADSHYYPNRPLDNFIPTLLAEDDFKIPSYHIGVYYSGGNFQCTTNRHGYCTQLLTLDNPSSQGLPIAYLQDLFKKYQGIDTLHVLGQLPFSVDGTGHIDMWTYIVDDTSVLVGQFDPNTANPTAVSVTEAGASYLAGLGFSVTRVPNWNASAPGTSNAHYTYTNAFRVNDRIFVPVYGTLLSPGGTSIYNSQDALAMSRWATAAPGVTLVPIQSYSIIGAAGAIHCIVMQVPRYTSPIPAAHVIWPKGGEVLSVGAQHEIEWSASDDVGVTSIDLYYSTDGGATYPNVIALGQVHDGRYTWTVPAAVGNQVRVRVVAKDASGNTGTGTSESNFKITPVGQNVYTFASLTGKALYGHQTTAWGSVSGQRIPATASTAVAPASLAKIAFSDATGGLADSNRYVSPAVGASSECTHTYEFSLTENPAGMEAIDIKWEGYTDNCTQSEMYVWDRIASQWGNGKGVTGQARYADNAATNRDKELKLSITSDFSRYLTPDNKLTVLIYGQRQADETAHDFVSVTVISGEAPLPCPADLDHDGVVGQSDLGAVLACYLLCPAGDIDGDGDTDQSDLGILLSAWGPCP